MSNAKKSFSANVHANLDSYVYCLIDPRDSKIFYIGKGKEDRVFAHLNGINDGNGDATNESLKIETIKEILNQGLEVKHYILRHGLSDDEAFLAESILIDLFNHDDVGFAEATKLANIMGGMYQRQYGIKSIDELELQYNAEPLDIDNLPHKIIFININQRLNKEDLYEVTRKFWKLSPERANQADYVICESKGITRAIFKVNEKGWQKAENFQDEIAFSNKGTVEKIEDLADLKGRYFFEGKEITDPELRSIYVTKTIHKDKGASNPIRYSYE